MKVIKMVKDDCITGVEYGMADIPDTEIKNKTTTASDAYQQTQQVRSARNARMRKNNTKHK